VNIDELTLGQIKQLQGIMGEPKATIAEKNPNIGKKVIIRTDRAGVHYGTLISKNGGECTISDAIRIWYWDGAASLSQLAVNGTKEPSNCKFAVPVESNTLPWIEIIPCTKEAQDSIEGVKSWEQ